MVTLHVSEICMCFAGDHSGAITLHIQEIQFIGCEITFKNNLHVLDVILFLRQINDSMREIKVCFQYYSVLLFTGGKFLLGDDVLNLCRLLKKLRLSQNNYSPNM